MNFLTLFVISMSVMQSLLCDEGPGTTKHLHDIFLGRCWDYQLVKHPDLLRNNQYRDCDELWDTFTTAFSFKEACDITLLDYQPFVKATEQDVSVNKSMFWSGVYLEAHEYADNGRRYITLEDTLLGYLVNGLTWCGQVTEPGINHESCPTWGSCSDEATTSFWGAASKAFAEQVRGEALIMLNGSNPNRPAFSTKSFFATFELPNMDPEQVSRLAIFVLHDLDVPERETCNNGSLIDLKKLIHQKGISYDCYDNPTDIIHMLCIDDAQSRECLLARKKMLARFRNRETSGPIARDNVLKLLMQDIGK